VRAIMEGIIRAAGADGLCNTEQPCGCRVGGLFGGLWEEDCIGETCELARVLPCVRCGERMSFPLATDPAQALCALCLYNDDDMFASEKGTT